MTDQVRDTFPKRRLLRLLLFLGVIGTVITVASLCLWRWTGEEPRNPVGPLSLAYLTSGKLSEDGGPIRCAFADKYGNFYFIDSSRNVYKFQSAENRWDTIVRGWPITCDSRGEFTAQVNSERNELIVFPRLSEEGSSFIMSVYSLESFSLTRTASLENDLPTIVYWIALSPDGNMLALNSICPVHVYDFSAGSLLARLKSLASVTCAAFSANGDALFLGPPGPFVARVSTSTWQATGFYSWRRDAGYLGNPLEIAVDKRSANIAVLTGMLDPHNPHAEGVIVLNGTRMEKVAEVRGIIAPIDIVSYPHGGWFVILQRDRTLRIASFEDGSLAEWRGTIEDEPGLMCIEGGPLLFGAGGSVLCCVLTDRRIMFFRFSPFVCAE